MRIDYSKLATLNVKYNNEKSRDYTNPNLPAGELTLDNPALALSLLGGAASAASHNQLLAATNPMLAGANPLQLQAAAAAAGLASLQNSAFGLSSAAAAAAANQASLTGGIAGKF